MCIQFGSSLNNILIDNHDNIMNIFYILYLAAYELPVLVIVIKIFKEGCNYYNN